MWPGRLAPRKAINWVAGLGGQLLSHLFPLLPHSLLSPLWKWVIGRRKSGEVSRGNQFCSSSHPLPGPWAFSRRPLGLKGWVAGVLPDQSWGPAGKDSIPCPFFTLSPEANIVVPGSAGKRHVKGIRLTVPAPCGPQQRTRTPLHGNRRSTEQPEQGDVGSKP